MLKNNHQRRLQRIVTQVLLLLITSILVYAALFYFTPASASATDLKAGDVAGQDILAPYAISYDSQVLTEQMREAAVQAVPAKYTVADTNVARQQLERLRLALVYISSVRADEHASVEQKLADLAALQDIQLKQETGSGILALSDPRWQSIQQEAIVVLEQVMRNTIRDTQIESYRASATNLVSLALPEDQAEIVAELAAAFITPNSFYSESLTELAKQQAYDNTPPVPVSFATGETIIRRGEVVSTVDIEALQKFGLAEPKTRWQDHASIGILVILFAILITIYFRRNPQLTQENRSLFIITALFTTFLIGARLVLPIHPLTAYIYPMAAFALIVAGLFEAETALVMVVPLIILATYGYSNAFELILYYGISSIFGVLIPRQEQRITGFIWVGLSVTASGVVIVTTYRLLDPETSGLSLLTLLAIAFLNGMISAGFTVLMQSVFAPLLGQTTPLQLLELSRPDHPLLEYLLRNAPGTYQHSLQVANLAEQAAERINANSLLTRVGALYHDIGKAQNSQFFIENQIPGQLDTHENLDPKKSAGIIINHVKGGVELAQKYKLPRRIQDFISEHHGTLKTQYQWTQAVKAAEGDASKLNESNFRYGGPSPQSRETALVMLADGCEARVRAQHPTTQEDLQAIIKKTIDTCLASGQLADTPLTLKDLDTIHDSFIATLKGIYHPRIEYPSLDVPTQPTLDLALEKRDQGGIPGPTSETIVTETYEKP
jgi:putative nucleotidyltransferase with HDIG domain